MSFGALALALLAPGCHRQPNAMPQMPPLKVNVITVQPRPLPITTEFPGRIGPVQIAQVSAQATGIVLSRDFKQGSDVTNGQVLYRIDPAPYRAALDSAKASVGQARANLRQAQLLAQRYKPLVGINAVSKQNYDTAVATADQDRAGVAAAQAQEESAAINLGYCTVTAPISGRIGPALVTPGALVSATTATEMAVIQQMDPIYFDFTESSQDILKLRKDIQAGRWQEVPSGEPKVTLELPDGTVYPHPGRLLFTDVSVDPTTGMVTLRAEFPNPDHWLLPGMFAVGRLEQAVAPQTILVPQPAVMVGPNGAASVMLVTPDNQVQSRPIQLGAAVGTDWIVESGLKAGDRVMVNGLQKEHPGMTVQPLPSPPTEGNSNAPAAGQ
jgi:membrane fusion protein, multidrug efflux system